MKSIHNTQANKTGHKLASHLCMYPLKCERIACFEKGWLV